MRILLWLAALGVALWSGYWYLGKSGIERGLSAWLEQRVDEGWQAEAAIRTSGFPLDFKTVAQDIALADPETGLAWTAPELRFSSRAWFPTAVTAVWPERQTISSPLERIDVGAGVMQAELTLEPGKALTLVSSDFQLRDISLTSNADWAASLERGEASTQRAGNDPLVHDIRFDARALRPSKEALARIDPAGLMPEVFEEVVLRAQVSFDAPWDRFAIEDRRPQITRIDLGGIRARWGEMQFEAAGDLEVDPAGTPEGRIVVRAVNWREMVQIAKSSGVLPEAFAPTLEQGLEILAGLRGNPETIDASLTFRDGSVSFGPIPLGPAPKLAIR